MRLDDLLAPLSRRCDPADPGLRAVVAAPCGMTEAMATSMRGRDPRAPPSQIRAALPRTRAVGDFSAAAYFGTPTFRGVFQPHGENLRVDAHKKCNLRYHPPGRGVGPAHQGSPWIYSIFRNSTRPPLVSATDSIPPTPLHWRSSPRRGPSPSPRPLRWCHRGRYAILPPPPTDQTVRN